MKKQEKCLSCGRIFWAKAIRNRVTRQVEALDNICQMCKNRMRQKENFAKSKKSRRVRIIPEEFEKQIKMRGLYQAEMERRQEENKKDSRDKSNKDLNRTIT